LPLQIPSIKHGDVLSAFHPNQPVEAPSKSSNHSLRGSSGVIIFPPAGFGVGLRATRGRGFAAPIPKSAEHIGAAVTVKVVKEMTEK